MNSIKIKYESPSFEIQEIEVKDIITASLSDNGQGEISDGDRTIFGEEGTLSGFFEDLLKS